MTEAYSPVDTLFLWWLGEPQRPRLVGELQLVQGNRAVALQYAPTWLASGFELSADLPLQPGLAVPREKDRAAGAVDDARPDRWGERVILKFETSPRMSILEYLLFAGDDRYGALGVSTSAQRYAPWPSTPIPGLGSLAEMAQVVQKILANEAIDERQRRLLRPGMSMGGARPKSLVEIDGEPWLVKFSEGEDLDTELIEHATMTLAARCGIEVASTRALPVGTRHAVAIRRFDRQAGLRVHAMSAQVALKAAGEELGYPNLAQLLRRLAPPARIAQQQEQLFKRMVFNLLMDNTDDHEKNHALLRQRDGSWLLSPAYDVVPSAHGLGYQALRVGDEGARSTLDNALSQARAFNLKLPAARALARDVAQTVSDWKAHFSQQGVTPADLDRLSQVLDQGPLQQERLTAQKS